MPADRSDAACTVAGVRKLSSASNVKFRAKSFLKPRPLDGPTYFPSPSYDLHKLPASVDARGLARGRFHRRAE
jgi:hypothetical protein